MSARVFLGRGETEVTYFQNFGQLPAREPLESPKSHELT